MGNEANKKFTWVIKNFSSYPAFGSKSVYSDIFVVGGCKWRLMAYPKGYYYYINDNNLTLHLVVPNHESLSSGWRRHAKFSFKIVNQIPGEVSQLREIQSWFDQKEHDFGFPFLICHSDPNGRDSGFFVNGELKIVAEIDVLDVVGKLDVPLETTNIVDINGVQVLASQVESVNSVFEKHPNNASNFRSKNPHMRTTYLNIILSLSEILCKSSEELSNSYLADAYSSLRYVTRAGFKLNWLEEALKDAGKTRIQEIEEELNDLTQKRADMEALLVFLK